LAREEQRTRGTMATSHQDLVQALAHDKGNLNHSLANLEAKGLIRIARTRGHKAERVDLIPEGRWVAGTYTSVSHGIVPLSS